VVIALPAKPSWPKESGNQCCLCVNYKGNDPRGPLWSGFGLCKIAPMEYKVLPNFVCKQFQFNEALRGT
jgi:hypothetical protein